MCPQKENQQVKFIAITTILFLISFQVYPRDTKLLLPIEEALQSSDFKDQLDPNIKFYFGDQKHQKVANSFGKFVTNKKTNAFGKSDDKACRWVLLSALISLQDRVKTEGGNAVINIVSYYKKDKFSSNNEFECHAGNIIAGVALQGEVVKLAE